MGGKWTVMVGSQWLKAGGNGSGRPSGGEGTKNVAASPYRLGQHSHTAFGGSVERHYFSSTEDVLARAVLAVLAVREDGRVAITGYNYRRAIFFRALV